MSLIKRVGKNLSAKALASIISRAFSFIFTIYIARVLGDIDFGKYSFAFAFVGLFAILADLGLNTLIVREIAKEKDMADDYIGACILIKLPLSIFVFGIICLIINLMHYPKDTTCVVYIASIFVIANSFIEFFIAVFAGFERMKYEAILTSVNKSLLLIIGLFLLHAGFGLYGAATAMAISSLIGSLLGLYLMIKKFIIPRFKVEIKFLASLIKKATPLILTTVFFAIYFRIDIVMLSIMRSDAEVGWYSAAYRLIEALMFIPAIYTASIYPVFSDLYKKSSPLLKSAYEKSFKILFTLGLPLTVGGVILSNKIILLLFGEQFYNSISVFQILILAEVFLFVNFPLNFLLISINKEWIVVLNSSLCMVLNIILNLLLIPKVGYIGAGIATVVTEIVFFLFNLYFLSKYFYIISIPKLVIKPILSTILMGMIIFYLREFNIFLLIGLGIIVYFGILFIIGNLSRKERLQDA